MSVASQSAASTILISVEETGKNQLQSGQEIMSSSGVTLFLTKKSLTKIDWCAGALS
jgi:hypothetical protein